MPVIRIYLDRLFELISEKLDEKELENYIFYLKGEIEGLDVQNNIMDIELTMDRPDLLISEGIARAIKGFMEKEVGQPKLELYKDDIELIVKSVPTRPYIAVGVLRNYRLDSKTLEELIQFQEKLHLTVGRKRKKIAIGIHDLDKLPSRKLEYTNISLDYKMIPLGSSYAVKVRDVLSSTPQGKMYGHYSIAENEHPAILSDGEIISLPPVLNSEITKLDTETKNILIDVTGTDEFMVLKTLDLLTSILSERGGTRIGLCSLDIDSNHYMTPGLTPTFIETTLDYVNKVLGLELSPEEIVKLGEKARWDVIITDNNNIKAAAPEYRLDILHPIDFVEDIAISYDYSKFLLKKIPITLKPKEDSFTSFKRILKKLMLGLNYTQVYNFSLISEEDEKVRLETDIRPLRILNPISNEMNIVRPSLIPSLLMTIRESQKFGLPLKVFEIGNFAFIDIKSNRLVQGEKLGIAIVNSTVSYEDIQTVVYSLLTFLDIPHGYSRHDSEVFIKGRSSAITSEGVLLGYVGEVSPEILLNNQIKHPVGLAEINVNILYELWTRRRSHISS